MKIPSPKLLIYAGPGLFVLGIIYDVRFAGIPFPDPTPAMQESWLFHGKVAANIRLAGLIVLAVGIGWLIAGRVLRRMRTGS